MTKIEQYNMVFSNHVAHGCIDKTVSLINSSDFAYVGVQFYLFHLTDIDSINEILSEVVKAANNQPFDDAIRLGSETIILTQNNVTIEDQGITAILPVDHFKSILQEYKDFFLSPPLNGSKVR